MAEPDLVLYHYWRSSASYRARIALNLKGLDYRIVPVHLLEDGGQQHHEAYRALNPQQLVPTLVHGGQAIGQSLAIIEYLDEVFPGPRLLPAEPLARAFVRGLALYIASEGQPMMNLRVLQHLQHTHGLDEDARNAWVRHWLAVNFGNIEAQLAKNPHGGSFIAGDSPGLAECCLVPHVFAAARFNLDMTPYPNVMRIVGQCQPLPAFARAHPGRQPDTPAEFRVN
ncbi:maleylacetoacetate isomerase [Arenimonas sp.]|jgi:maleylacetoacetate isomerase|uniref:maleylacetoacetate isomerase n=1 Tax=Arenimonas sp. TaxID=1872635 RepID=UPI0037C18E90